MRVIRCIRGTLYLTLILRFYRLSVIKLWNDESFAEHPYFKGHTGDMMSMGSGSIIELLWKQKINGRSSMEAEIVGAYESLPH